MRDDGDYFGGWNCGFNHLKATVTNRYHLQLPEKIGVKLEYSISSIEARERILKNKKAYFTLQDPEGAITNSALGELSARNNPTNNVVYYKAGDQKELGVYPYHLRILGEGHGAEIGATIAIEHQNHLYVPMHDLFGNIIALLSPDGRVLESYRYTTFGEEEITTEGGCIALQSFLNPWRYQSKRKITHLVYFGRRFYDPETGRWLSPDPKGFDEGPNLYQFVQNNPLIYFDFYGLSTESGDKYSVRYWAEGLKYIYYYTARTTLEGFATGNPRQMVAPMNAYRAIQNFVSGRMERPDIPHSKVYWGSRFIRLLIRKI